MFYMLVRIIILLYNLIFNSTKSTIKDMKLIHLITIFFFISNIYACSRIHGTGDHCDHIYRACLGNAAMLPPKQRIVKEGICYTVCLGCKGLSR